MEIAMGQIFTPMAPVEIKENQTHTHTAMIDQWEKEKTQTRVPSAFLPLCLFSKLTNSLSQFRLKCSFSLRLLTRSLSKSARKSWEKVKLTFPLGLCAQICLSSTQFACSANSIRFNWSHTRGNSSSRLPKSIISTYLASERARNKWSEPMVDETSWQIVVVARQVYLREVG